jgi:pimeloyl-ACP methyl ester carboxylesterase
MKNAFILISIFSLTLFTSSCKKDKEITPNVNEPEALVLQYSDSPIDLKGDDAKFAFNIPYDDKVRTEFDIFLPQSSSPTGLVIYMHGGGFQSGDKSVVYSTQMGGAWDFPEYIRSFLKDDIAFATINYSLLESDEKEGVIKSLKDGKRALQFMRYHAETLNIDKDQIVMAGNSAGAGISAWLAFHDDMKETSSSDLVLRESSRIKGCVLLNTQATYDVEKWTDVVFKEYNIPFALLAATNKATLEQFYGMENYDTEYNTPLVDNYRKEVDMLAWMSNDDPEFWVNNTLTDVVMPTDLNVLYHHAYHAKALKEEADKKGVKNVSYYGKNPVIFEDPSGEDWVSFAKRKIAE